MNDHKQWEREMSKEFSGMMDGIRSKPMQEDSLQRTLAAAEAIGMTKASWIRGLINASIALLVVWSVLG